MAKKKDATDSTRNAVPIGRRPDQGNVVPACVVRDRCDLEYGTATDEQEDPLGSFLVPHKDETDTQVDLVEQINAADEELPNE